MTQVGDEPKAVYVWISATSEPQNQAVVRSNYDNAQDWIEMQLGSEGGWTNSETSSAVDQYEVGEATGTVQLAPIPDAKGLVVQGEPHA